MSNPHTLQRPRLRGATIQAVDGEIIPPGTPCPVDDAEAVNEARSVIRIADFDGYRAGNDRPISLGSGGEVIKFRSKSLPDMSNVIAAQFGRPDTPPSGAPAAAMRRAT